jgi:hypothetical protein
MIEETEQLNLTDLNLQILTLYDKAEISPEQVLTSLTQVLGSVLTSLDLPGFTMVCDGFAVTVEVAVNKELDIEE